MTIPYSGYGFKGMKVNLRGNITHARILFGKTVSKTVFIAILIAFPISYIIARKWLDSFAYKIELTWWHFAGTGMLVLSVTALTVGLQAVKAALANPAKSLKDE